MPDRDAPGPRPDRAPPHQAVLSRVLTGLLDDVQAHSGAVYVLDPGENVLVMTAIAGLPRVFAAPWERVGLAAPIPVADAARERRLVWVGGEEEMAGRYPRIAVVLPYPFALAALPVATADTVYGAVYATWPGSHPADLTRHERERLGAACDRLAEYMEWAAGQGRPVLPEPGARPVEPQGEVRAAEAARMAARLPYGLCALDLDGRVEYANQASADLLGVPVERLLGTAPWVTLPWLNDPMYEDRYRAALLSQRITSFVALRPPGDWLSFRLYPGTTGLSVRITRARATPRGGRPQRDAGEGPGRLVTISHVLSLASALTEAVGVRDVIDLVADEIMPAVGSRTLVMLGSSGGRLHVLGQRGYEDPSVVDRFDGMPLTAQTPGVRALLTGVPGFYESRGQLERLYPIRYATPDGMAAWAYLPLVASGRAVGTCVLGYAEERTFTAEERAVLTSVGGLIAQALERARLYDAKHRLAHGLQEALLPDTLPDLPGLEVAARYLPGTQGMDIGGDFYDLVPVGTAAAAVIGDVQGHNVTAAGLMGQVRTAVRAYTAVGQTPGRVMESTNRLLVDLATERFASCIYLHLDTARGRALLARAGHPQPLLRDPDGRVRTLDLAGGPLLGIDADAVYPTTEVPLPPGSVLALYTDGLVEIAGVDLDESVAAVADRLADVGGRPLEEVADSLVRHVQETQGRSDDVALLLLRPG
ncbi:SpoIIE family protein phosphatase [Streptomyces sp. BPTC-684]|uniref:SpoIIE family protein phosphatase n=1 Tax=Streptomyces sp. BPTC-684 TaxID=3043734 RepID=UPI0024B19368|nr:SpoIIE family protein phosphatase [Streptomyces sp. BPTC-684]WHM40130.1 SpoIIE family protein phosphatase [Streptomyces sp. BPTC-684]